MIVDRKEAMDEGWVLFSDRPPPVGQRVLVTNNPRALDGHDLMCRIWITDHIYIHDGEWSAYTDGNTLIHRLVSWHRLPAPPTTER